MPGLQGSSRENKSLMLITANPDTSSRSSPREFISLPHTRLVALLFSGLIAAEIAAFLLFGTGHTGSVLAQITIVLASLVTLSCTWIAFQRARDNCGSQRMLA